LQGLHCAQQRSETKLSGAATKIKAMFGESSDILRTCREDSNPVLGT